MWILLQKGFMTCSVFCQGLSEELIYYNHRQTVLLTHVALWTARTVWLNHATPDTAGMQLGQCNIRDDLSKGQLSPKSLVVKYDSKMQAAVQHSVPVLLYVAAKMTMKLCLSSGCLTVSCSRLCIGTICDLPM